MPDDDRHSRESKSNFGAFIHDLHELLKPRIQDQRHNKGAHRPHHGSYVIYLFHNDRVSGFEVRSEVRRHEEL